MYPLAGRNPIKAQEAVAATRVLIVDDDASVRQLLSVVLPLVGNYLIVGEASDGLQAMRLAAGAEPDIVVLDYMMPVQNGSRTAADLKQLVPGADIIFFSAYTDALDPGQDMFRTSIEYGCEIVPKGDTTRLEEALGRVTERRERFRVA